MGGREEFEKTLRHLRRVYTDMPPGGYKSHLFLIISRMVEVLEDLMPADVNK